MLGPGSAKWAMDDFLPMVILVAGVIGAARTLFDLKYRRQQTRGGL